MTDDGRKLFGHPSSVIGLVRGGVPLTYDE